MEPMDWDNEPYDFDDSGRMQDEDRCEADARIGTGYGVCLARLDKNGACPMSRRHVRD